MDEPIECLGCHQILLFDSQEEFNAHQFACVSGGVKIFRKGEELHVGPPVPGAAPEPVYSYPPLRLPPPSNPATLANVADVELVAAAVRTETAELSAYMRRQAVLNLILANREENETEEDYEEDEDADDEPTYAEPDPRAANPLAFPISYPGSPFPDPASTTTPDPISKVRTALMTWNLLLIIVAIVCFLLAAFGAAIGEISLVALGLAFFAAAHISGDSRVG